jgi:tetratricopeptide (TPR) repeat protein
MACRTALLAATIVAAFSTGTFADRYPRVYSPTGRPYGPTVAGYQYQRQYGQPWHGYRGGYAPPGYGSVNVRVSPFPGFAFGFGPGYGYGYGGYPPYVGNYYLPAVPAEPVPYYGPNYYSPNYYQNPYDNPVIQDGLRENADRWGQPVQPAPLVKAPREVAPSSPEAVARSVRKQEFGDTWLKKIDYVNAMTNYRSAVLIAPERAEPKFRLAFVLAAMGQHAEAVEEFKRGLEIDPSWPSNSPTFEQLIGPENLLEKSNIQHRAAEWVRRDVRDPNRLFLMGVLLHFDRNAQANVFFETAYRLAGQGDHLVAFLRPVAADGRAAAQPAPQKPQAAAPREQGNFPPPPPLPAPELGPAQPMPPAQVKPPAATVIPQKKPAEPKAAPPAEPKLEGDAPPKPDSLLNEEKKEEKKETPPADPKPEPAAAAAPENSQPAAVEEEAGPQLVAPE